MEIFKLFGSVFVDTKKAEESTHKVGEKAEGIGSKFKKGLGTAVKWGAGIAASASVGAAALYKTAEKAAQTTDRVDKMSQKLGISRKSFQELDFVMSQSGMSIDNFGAGMKTMLSTMENAKNGNSQAISKFKQLGVAVTDSSGKMRSQEAVLYDSIKAFQKMESSSEKAKLAQELFGKQGQQIMPLLNGQAGSFEELTQKANELGLVLGDDTVNAGVKLTDTIDQADRTFGAIITRIGAGLMPVIQAVLDFILAHMPEIQAVVGTVFSAISAVVTTVMGILKDYFIPIIIAIVDSIKEHWPAISSVITEVMDTVKLVIGTALKFIKWLWGNYGGIIKGVVAATFNGIKNIVTGVMKVIRGIIRLVMAIIKGDWSGAWNAIKSIVTGIFKVIKGVIVAVLGHIKGAFSAVWRTLVTITSVAWNAIKKAIMAPFKAAFNFVKGIINGIKGLFRFKFTWPKIPLPHFKLEGSLNPIKWIKQGLPKLHIKWYATGGIMKKPTMFGYDPFSNTAHVGGEAGPEAIAPISTLQSYIQQAVSAENSKILAALLEILAEIKEKDDKFIGKIKGLIEEYKIEWNDRELARFIKNYV